MSLFSREDINAGITEYQNTPGALLIDVREPGEYEKGFIPDAANIPLSKIDQITAAKDTPIFVYCLRGRRSKKAVKKLIRMGYTNVKGIGGIKKYTGQRAK